MSYFVQIHKLPGNEDVLLPRKMSEQASGYDLYAAVESDVILEPGARALIPTGISLAMPDRLEAQIYVVQMRAILFFFPSARVQPVTLIFLSFYF